MDGVKGIARGISVSYGRNEVAKASWPDTGMQAEGAKEGFVHQEAGGEQHQEKDTQDRPSKTPENEQTWQEWLQAMQQGGQAVWQKTQDMGREGQAVWQKNLNTDQAVWQEKKPVRNRAPRAVVKRVGAYNRWRTYFKVQSTASKPYGGNSQARNTASKPYGGNYQAGSTASKPYGGNYQAGNTVSKPYGGNSQAGNTASTSQGINAKGQNGANTKKQAMGTEEQNTAQTIWLIQKNAEERRQKAKEQEEQRASILDQLKQQAEAIKKAFDPKKRKNLYDATMDLTLIAQMEKIAGLKAIQSRLMFQVRSVKASGAESSEIRCAVNKLKKVIGKAKAKVKSLEKETLMEKKRKRAAEAKRKAKELALRRELEWRKKTRKAREYKDIEESKMGMGANYGGPTGDPALDMAMEAYMSMGSAEMTLDVGAVVDVAVADVGVAVADAGAVDVSL